MTVTIPILSFWLYKWLGLALLIAIPLQVKLYVKGRLVKWQISLTFGRLLIKSWALDIFVAFFFFFCVTPSFPYRIFSAIVVAKRTGSWFTTPMCSRNHFNFRLRMSWPSTVTFAKTKAREKCYFCTLNELLFVSLSRSQFQRFASKSAANHIGHYSVPLQHNSILAWDLHQRKLSKVLVFKCRILPRHYWDHKTSVGAWQLYSFHSHSHPPRQQSSHCQQRGSNRSKSKKEKHFQKNLLEIPFI